MAKIEITFGINIVEIVTKGLYTNSLDALREYVQNSCDAIDDAINGGTLEEDDGRIIIDLDKINRRITIEDNGIGLSTRDFQRVMSNIGASDKRQEISRGFRGIGRLGGLAYCKTLIFSSKVAGAKKISRLIFTADELRKEFWKKKNASAENVLIDNMHFDAIDADSETPEHFFRVEMIDIVDTNKDLLDVVKVRDYLSFVAPVTYSPNFIFQTEIYKHAAALNFKIAEYKIEVNGEQLVKNYKSDVKARKAGNDKIFGVEFRDIYDDTGKLIAWLWFGLSTFKGILSEEHKTDSYKMRGLRLRVGNIQIGNWNTLGDLFNEKSRGTKYFIGEVHAVDENLTPNSKRDDLEEDEASNALRDALTNCFRELDEIYRDASKIRNKYDATSQSENESVKKSSAQKEVAKILQKVTDTPDSALAKVVTRIIENQPKPESPKSDKTNGDNQIPPPRGIFPPSDWSDKQRDIYRKIEGIVRKNPKLAGDKLLDKIKEELAK